MQYGAVHPRKYRGINMKETAATAILEKTNETQTAPNGDDKEDEIESEYEVVEETSE